MRCEKMFFVLLPSRSTFSVLKRSHNKWRESIKVTATINGANKRNFSLIVSVIVAFRDSYPLDAIILIVLRRVNETEIIWSRVRD